MFYVVSRKCRMFFEKIEGGNECKVPKNKYLKIACTK